MLSVILYSIALLVILIPIIYVIIFKKKKTANKLDNYLKNAAETYLKNAAETLSNDVFSSENIKDTKYVITDVMTKAVQVLDTIDKKNMMLSNDIAKYGPEPITIDTDNAFEPSDTSATTITNNYELDTSNNDSKILSLTEYPEIKPQMIETLEQSEHIAATDSNNVIQDKPVKKKRKYTRKSGTARKNS